MERSFSEKFKNICEKYGKIDRILQLKKNLLSIESAFEKGMRIILKIMDKMYISKKTINF